MTYAVIAVERAMKIQEVILRAMSGALTWLPAADILEDMILPNADRIAETVRRSMEA